MPPLRRERAHGAAAAARRRSLARARQQRAGRPRRRAQGRRDAGVPKRTRARRSCSSALLPALVIVAAAGAHCTSARPRPTVEVDTAGLVEAGGAIAADGEQEPAEPATAGAGRRADGLAEPPAEDGARTAPADGAAGGGAEGRRPPAAAAAASRRGRRAGRERAPGARPGSGSCSASASRRSSCSTALWTLAAARDLQDAADLVLPAGGADPRGARLDRVRAGDADRGGGGRRVRRLRAGGGLPLHRALARERRAAGGGAVADDR